MSPFASTFSMPFLSAQTFKEFMFGGNAVFSVKSKKTDKHYTYKVKRKNDIYYVTFLGGQSNWHYIGHINRESKFDKDRKVPAYLYRHDAFTVFMWLKSILDKGRLPQDAELYHSGKCGMCGRKLTDPISVQEGFGPECREKRLRHNALQ